MEELKERIEQAPRWAIPAIVGAAVGLIMLFRKKNAPPPSTAPVAAATPKDYQTSDYSDIAGVIQRGNEAIQATIKAGQESGPDWQGLFQGQTDLFEQLSAQQADLAQQAAARDAAAAQAQAGFWAGVLDALKKMSSPVTAPAAPAAPAPATPPPAEAPPSTPGGVPVTPPPPSTAPTPPASSTGATAADWAALAYFLGGKAFSPGGTHWPGERVEIRWKDAPYYSQEPPPPSGNYPALSYPVKFNGDHASWRAGGESAFTRTLRWVADYMSRNPSANATTVWDGMLGRLMKDMGPYVNNPGAWYETGFDLGSVRNSPYLDGNGTPNPSYVRY